MPASLNAPLNARPPARPAGGSTPASTSRPAGAKKAKTPGSSGGRKKKQPGKRFNQWVDHDKDLPAMSGMAAVNHHCKFIAVYNYKGGVGKTTTVKELAGTLALMGKRVAMMDADYQCNLTSFCLDTGNAMLHAASSAAAAAQQQQEAPADAAGPANLDPMYDPAAFRTIGDAPRVGQVCVCGCFVLYG